MTETHDARFDDLVRIREARKAAKQQQRADLAKARSQLTTDTIDDLVAAKTSRRAQRAADRTERMRLLKNLSQARRGIPKEEPQDAPQEE